MFTTNKQKFLCLVSIFTVSIFAFPVYATGAFTIFGKPAVDIVNDLIKTILSYTGKISLLVLIFGGVFYIVSGSDPQKQETAKKTITYAIFGLMLVLLSYAVLSLLSKTLT